MDMIDGYTFEKIAKIVDELNEEIYEINGDDETAYVDLAYYGNHGDSWLVVKFLDQHIWDNQDGDERMLLDEEKEVYEPLETFLRRSITDFVDQIALIGDKLMEKKTMVDATDSDDQSNTGC